MEVKYVSRINYKKLKELLEKENYDSIDDIIDKVKSLEIARHSEIVASAGSLSRFKGDVDEVLSMREDKSLEQNAKYAKNIIGMGHDSISDHDYLVFAIKDVTPIIEQIIIGERYSSFTIKSRREVDFSKAGYYVPKFRDSNGNYIDDDVLYLEYKDYMDNLFKKYGYLVESGIPLEDARFILPYSFYSNIIMGVDVHTLKDMIIKYTKGEYRNISEVYDFGMKLKDIAREYAPYIIDIIDKEDKREDRVKNILDGVVTSRSYEIIDRPRLINRTKDIDKTIVVSAIMRRYQFDYDKALRYYDKIKDNDELMLDIMRLLAFNGDGKELKSVMFDFQVPTSLAVLTHLTRHRTQEILVPDFKNIDLRQYKVPASIKREFSEEYDSIYRNNYLFVNMLKEKFDICDDDLIYFNLAGNMVNVGILADGYSLCHILGLRECNKTQWETREIAHNIHNEIRMLDDAKYFNRVLGPSCETRCICKEGKESCGKIKGIVKKLEKK